MRSFATKLSIYHPDVVREAEYQQDGLPRNFTWGSWQAKSESWTHTARSNSLRAKGGLFCNLCWPHVNCKQGWYIMLFHHHCRRNIMPTIQPTNKKIKCRVERHKLTCLEETFCPAFKNKNNADWFSQLQRCSAQGICSIGSNCKLRCLQRCTATFTWHHLIIAPKLWVTVKWFLWHHNAQQHMALWDIEFSSVHQITTLPHAPYYPDLSPCDFFYS